MYSEKEIFNKIFSQFKPGSKVGSFIVQQNSYNEDRTTEGMVTLSLNDCLDKFHLKIVYVNTRNPYYSLHFERISRNIKEMDEQIFHSRLHAIVKSKEKNLVLRFNEHMNLTAFDTELSTKRDIVHTLRTNYGYAAYNPYFTGTIEQLQGGVLEDVVCKMLNLFYAKYLLRSSLSKRK